MWLAVGALACLGTAAACLGAIAAWRRPVLRARDDDDDASESAAMARFESDEHRRKSGIPLRAILLAMQRQQAKPDAAAFV